MSVALQYWFKKKLKKTPMYLLTGALVLGVFLVIGFLSFTGMLSIYASIGFAIAAFLLAALVEGQVYFKNINQAVKKLFHNKLTSIIYLKHLKSLKKQNENCRFLHDYRTHEKAIAASKKAIQASKILLYNAINSAKETKTISEELEKREALLLRQKKKLKWMQQYFIDAVNGTIQEKDKDNELEAVISPVRLEIQKEIDWKIGLSKACLVASIVSGIGYGFVFLHAAPESIVALATYFNIELTIASLPLALTIGIYVFAFAAAVGFMLLIYNTLTDMVVEDSISKGFKKIGNFFKPQQDKVTGKIETTTEVIFRVGFWTLFVLAMVALGAFATVTTAGTWWNEAQASITYLMPFLGKAVTWICGITVAVMGITMLSFNLFNALRAVKALSQGSFIAVEKSLQAVERRIKNCYDNESFLQFINPFRAIYLLISIPFTVLVFLGHIIATGLIGEESNLMPKQLSGLTTFFNALQDGMVDGFFLFSDDEHGHSHAGHDHSHAGIPELFLKVVLSPVLFMSFLWELAFSKLTLSQAGYRALFGVEEVPEDENRMIPVTPKDTPPSDALIKVVNCKVDKKLYGLAWSEHDRSERTKTYVTKVFNPENAVELNDIIGQVVKSSKEAVMPVQPL